MAVEQNAGYIRSTSSITPMTNVTGHPGMSIYRLARPPETSRWLLVALNDVQQGGGIDIHYHEGMDADHAYYVVDGEVTAWIGDETFQVGPQSLMFFPSGELHGFKVTSPEGARILRLGASPDGIATGNSVWVEKVTDVDE